MSSETEEIHHHRKRLYEDDVPFLQVVTEVARDVFRGEFKNAMWLLGIGMISAVGIFTWAANALREDMKMQGDRSYETLKTVHEEMKSVSKLTIKVENIEKNMDKEVRRNDKQDDKIASFEREITDIRIKINSDIGKR